MEEKDLNKENVAPPEPEAKKPKQKSLTDRIWDIFASVKLAIVIFVLIGASSIVGTVVEQNGDPEKNIKIIGEIVGHSMAPAVHNLLYSMGFMDMYGSWWFLTFLFLFAANLFICSLDRFPAIWKTVNDPMKPLADDHFKIFAIKREVTVKGKADDIKGLVAAGMKNMGFAPVEAEGQFYAQAGRWSRLGVYVTHLSILVILAGAVIGIFFGFKGFVNIAEGESALVAFVRTRSLTNDEYREREILYRSFVTSQGNMAQAAKELGVGAEQLSARMKRLGLRPLGFFVTCEDFKVDYYGKSDMPKAYTSHLSVTDNGKKVQDKWIVVNDPLIHKGIYFYQSNYGLTEDTSKVVYRIKASSTDGKTGEIGVHMGESFMIPGTMTQVTVTEFSPALTFDATGKAVTYDEMFYNPAIKIKYIDGGNEYSQWVLIRYPETWKIGGGHVIEFKDAWGAQYTGLQVRQDPGVMIVYLGCLIMAIGLYATFFMTHRRIYVRLRQDKGGVIITVAGSAHKFKESFEKKIDEMLSRMREGGK